MSEEGAVLTANQDFYDAFAAGDDHAMDALWATGVPTACIHPGWRALNDRAQIIDSWRAILKSPPPIVASEAEATVFDQIAFVICTETIEGTTLVATNIFAKQAGGWKMIHHQAGHVMAPVPTASAPPRVVH